MGMGEGVHKTPTYKVKVRDLFFEYEQAEMPVLLFGILNGSWQEY